MNNIGNIGTSSVNSSDLGQVQNGAAKETTFQHSQLGKGVASGLDTSFLEEASINISHSKKIESKDEKKDKDTLKKLLEEAQKKVPDLPGAEQLDQCMQKMMSKMKSGNLKEEDIKEQLSRYSGDSTHQHLALEAIIETLKSSSKEIDQELVGQLQEYSADFYENESVNIKAGLNVSSAANEFTKSSDLGSMQELRDIWRSSLQIPEINNALEAVNFAQEKVDGKYEKIGEGIRWMTDALAKELEIAETERSVDAIQLNFVRSQLEQVFGVKTIYETCINLESKLDRLILDESKGTF